MKILKRILPLAFVAIASTAEADFLEAIQMSPKAHKQLEISESSGTITGTYKSKDNGFFAAISGGNKSAAAELGPYWKQGRWNLMATEKMAVPYEGNPSLTTGMRVTEFYGPFSIDAGGFYTIKDGPDTVAVRVTPGFKTGSVRSGVEYTNTNGKSSANAIVRYDGKINGVPWNLVGAYGKDKVVKIRFDF